MNNFLQLPEIIDRPKDMGINSLIDNGLATGIFCDILDSHHPLIGHVKFGWGTSLVTKDIQQKIDACKKHEIEYFFGGTLFEKSLLQNKVDDFIAFCQFYDCKMIEISNGTIDLTNENKTAYIEKYAPMFTILSEVGYKDNDRSKELSPKKWIEYIHQDFAAGASYVILEARESGTSGICRADGDLRFGLFSEVVESGVDLNRLIFEAPNKSLQTYFIDHLGPSINMGNISPFDIIGVETLRLGLRSDTLISMEKRHAL
ncbi:MAG: phosphosulfolactate synthase [Bdellovibrionota bacterium]